MLKECNHPWGAQAPSDADGRYTEVRITVCNRM